MPKSALDKDLKKVGSLEEATHALSRSIAAPGLAILFLVAIFLFMSGLVPVGPLSIFVIAGGVIAGYMALNIGANDVANNMGPAVGSRALPLGAALVIAAVCEAAGAILAGGDVVSTISKSIIVPPPDFDVRDFVMLMMASFLAAGMWLHLATILNAPVSTTHSIVGGVLGAGIAAAGFGVVSWPTMGAIAASWVISPIMGGVVAAALLGFIKWQVLFKPDRVAAAKRWVPVMIGLMAGVFAMYLALKGLSHVWKPSAGTVWALGIAFFATGTLATRPWVARRAETLENRRKHVAGLFTLPLIFAAGLLSFAHGANDVANAVGPLAAIVAAAETGRAVPGDVTLPLWVLMIGAVGISLGLALFGPRLIRTVGTKITKMDAPRAYCVALAAAITVLIASALGLPVSSTHIAIGGVFGVGFLREQLANLGLKADGPKRPKPKASEPSSLSRTPEDAIKKQLKREKRRLVRRRHVLGIAAAWVITVPAAGGLAALLYWILKLVVDL
ncbi:inorganic phosphate transporter [Parvibaculum sp.]|uniref:inorganic phosphate transporter n=1 Tax=Parvibaculum sp. TaxID=2024848 RepID=UPI00272F7E40|nr:inorganic phosphate transporter [Parvibaculum sp.]MDP1627493.1 inorganic phosphate transporter [Parvibaculum sp.]MDP2148672.1 inorganic phosphate transporter [Parvibaculum sp.]MDP3326698.1 inorganic phosphate transporter [Parvibaculum sp.]